MPTDLATVIRTYLEDEAFHENWRNTIASRERSIPTLKEIVTRFVDGQTDLKTFRGQIDRGLRTTDIWGATGTGWLMEINKLPKYHGQPGEAGLRRMLTGLNADNLGQRIEAFYSFLAQEKQRLRENDNHNATNPGSAAFVVSLFAFWLDRDNAPPIYYVSLRRGLRMLLDAGLLPASIGLHVGYDAIDVRSENDHRAVMQALDSIISANPRVKTDVYWAEKFLIWITENPDALRGEVIVDVPQPRHTVIVHAPLPATPEPLSSRLISEVGSRILVGEDVLRRIYHALLAGHVILTGPPGTGKTELARLIPELLW